MTKLKRWLFAAVFFALPCMLLAQEAQDPLDDALSQVQTTMTGWITKLVPVMLAILVAGLIIWFIPRFVRYLKAAFAGGSGR